MGWKFDIDKAVIMIAFALVATFILNDATEDHWKKITSPEGGFACSMPASPKLDSQVIEVNGVRVQTKVFSAWNRAKSEFTLSYFDDPRTVALSQDHAEKMLDRLGQILTHGDESRMLFAQKLALKGYSGRHYAAHTENNTDADEMVYLVKRRVYLLVVVHERGGDQEAVKRFFESFTFEPQ